MKEQTPILVLGGTGKTGRRVVSRLQDMNIPVRIGSRNAPIPFSWQDPSGWPAILEGIRTAFVIYVPDLASEGAREDMERFAEAARQSGLERIVLLSGRGEPRTIPAEATIHGFDWTVLRASWFNQNFDEYFFADPLRAGLLQLPVRNIPEPFIDVNDIAEAAVAVLTQEGHSGKVYELTGPRALTFADAVAEISRAAGRPMTFEQITIEAYTAGMQAMGLPQNLIDLTLYLYGEVLDGRNTPATTGVRDILGRDPIDFADFAREAAARGAWAMEEVSS